MDTTVNHLGNFRKCCRLVAIDILCFENRKSFPPLPHLSISASMKIFSLLLTNRFGKGGILFWTVHPLCRAVIVASGYRKEFAHDKYSVLVTVTVDYRMLCLASSFLPVACENSLSSSFPLSANAEPHMSAPLWCLWVQHSSLSFQSSQKRRIWRRSADWTATWRVIKRVSSVW